ncbi:ATP-binding protein, partial [Myxococcota bacterium]|nr:ATP-binding protein [Myxococcota bacterium]
MLKDVISSQMREAERKLAEPYVPRDVRWPDGDDDMIRVVIGPRRAGKSFLALHKMGETGRFGYVNFD